MVFDANIDIKTCGLFNHLQLMLSHEIIVFPQLMQILICPVTKRNVFDRFFRSIIDSVDAILFS